MVSILIAGSMCFAGRDSVAGLNRPFSRNWVVNQRIPSGTASVVQLLRAAQVGTELKLARLPVHGDKLLAVFLPYGGPAAKALHGYSVLAGRDRELGGLGRVAAESSLVEMTWCHRYALCGLTALRRRCTKLGLFVYCGSRPRSRTCDFHRSSPFCAVPLPRTHLFS